MADSPSRNPLRAALDIRREELPFALLMFGYFFLVITSFWILKPLKKSLFIEFYDQSGFDAFGLMLSGPDAEQLAKVLNMVVAFVAVTVFSALAVRLRRQQLTLVFTAFFLASYGAYFVLLREPGDWSVWSFYLFGDLFSTLMVATFFAFLNDSVTPEAAKRLYGLVGLGGVTGGVFGTTAVLALLGRLTRPDWLLVCAVIGVAIAAVAFAAGRIVERHPPPETEPSEPEAPSETNPALAGARLVARSRYLLAIVAIVGLYELVSTVMDYQFTRTVAHYLDGPAIGAHFSRVYAFTNVLSMSVQLFFTSWVMTRFGVGTALMVLPIAALAGSGTFAVLPILWVGSALNPVDNAFSYSINQSAKEALYVPTSKREKYQAKAFIDMFVQRFAKAVAVGVNLVVGIAFADFSSVRWLAAFTVPVILVWLYAARYAGRRFQDLAGERG